MTIFGKLLRNYEHIDGENKGLSMDDIYKKYDVEPGTSLDDIMKKSGFKSYVNSVYATGYRTVKAPNSKFTTDFDAEKDK